MQILLPASLFATSSNINIAVCNDSPVIVAILSPVNGTKTNQSSILITGDATPLMTVTIFRNNSQVGFVTTNSDGSFSITASLVVGNNGIEARISDGCGKSASSGLVTVIRTQAQKAEQPTGNPNSSTSQPEEHIDPQKPSAQDPSDSPTIQDRTPSEGMSKPPVITEPTNNTKTSQASILVTGEADPLITIQIMRNGSKIAEVLTDANGRFSVSVPLVEGENHLIAIANPGPEETRSEGTTVIYAAPIITEQVAAIVMVVVAGGTAVAVLGFLLNWHFKLPNRAL